MNPFNFNLILIPLENICYGHSAFKKLTLLKPSQKITFRLVSLYT